MKDTLTIGKEFKKYTLDNYKEFCENALVVPPMEEFEDGTIDEAQWSRDHMIRIMVGEHAIELEYFADNVNEIEWALREMYKAEYGDGEPTTGNIVGSEYRDATWKDVLRVNILRRIYDGDSMKVAINSTINDFGSCSFMETMKVLTDYSNELKINFSHISSDGMENLFNSSARKQAIKEMICSKIELSEMVDKDGKFEDKTVITDYSIHPAGHFVGWHYGVDWDVNSETNQHYINDYIKGMIG